MGLFRKPVTQQELRDYQRGKPVRPEVAREAAELGIGKGRIKAGQLARRRQLRAEAEKRDE